MEFYRRLKAEGEQVRVGMEAGPPCQWFRRLLGECGHELWVGDAARIRAAAVGKKKTDREDAKLILQMMREDRFPRIWVPREAERDVRQLLLDRHHRVRTRTAAKNQLQALAMNQGLQKGRRLWTEAGRELLAGLTMSEYAARRRDYLLREWRSWTRRSRPWTCWCGGRWSGGRRRCGCRRIRGWGRRRRWPRC